MGRNLNTMLQMRRHLGLAFCVSGGKSCDKAGLVSSEERSLHSAHMSSWDSVPIWEAVVETERKDPVQTHFIKHGYTVKKQTSPFPP